MPKPIVAIGVPSSTVSADLAAEVARRGGLCHALSLDAPLENGAVTVTPGAVVWEGVDLLQAGAIFVERPVFPWPQARLPARELRGEAAYRTWFVFQREATSLVASAVAAAAELVPVVNPPAAVHLAVSPSLALDRLARDGLPLHSWALEPAPADRTQSALVVDACGRDRWHSPSRPLAGEPALVFEPFSGHVDTFLVVGEKTVGAIRHPSGEAWANRTEMGEASERPEPARGTHSAATPLGPDAAAAAGRLATQATKALGLHLAAVSICGDAASPAILHCDASPDLAAWTKHLGRRLDAALAIHLMALAAKE